MMKYRWYLALLTMLPAIACTFTPNSPDEAPEGDRLTISIGALHEDSIIITYTTGSCSRFVLPYHFFDNPIEPTGGPLVRDLRVIDANGVAVDTISETEQFGRQINTIAVLPAKTEMPVTVTYRLDLSKLHHDNAWKMMPEVHIRDSSLFLIGAYCLILPQTGTSLTGFWRTPNPMTLTIHSPSGLSVYGIPSKSFTCANNYELMFLQLCAGGDVVGRGRGGNADFVFIDYLGLVRPPGRIDSLANTFSAILDDIAMDFGPFTGAPYTVSFQNIWGGLEGTFGFSITEPAEIPGIRFGEILAHEALHHFIGVRCGDRDDPWWKESAAAWLGLETAVRRGYYEKHLFRDRMTKRFDLADTARFQRSLADPLLRADLFPDTLYALAYDRGAQVMMLLDVSIRRGSAGASTLAGAMATLCRKFSGEAFGREDFLLALEKQGARDAREIFSALVDTPDSVMTEEVLQRTFDEFDSLVPY